MRIAAGCEVVATTSLTSTTWDMRAHGQTRGPNFGPVGLAQRLCHWRHMFPPPNCGSSTTGRSEGLWIVPARAIDQSEHAPMEEVQAMWRREGSPARRATVYRPLAETWAGAPGQKEPGLVQRAPGGKRREPSREVTGACGGTSISASPRSVETRPPRSFGWPTAGQQPSSSIRRTFIWFGAMTSTARSMPSGAHRFSWWTTPALADALGMAIKEDADLLRRSTSSCGGLRESGWIVDTALATDTSMQQLRRAISPVVIYRWCSRGPALRATRPRESLATRARHAQCRVRDLLGGPC